MATFAIYYPTGCEVEEVAHQCDECADVENGRIRSVAFIASDFEFTNPSNAQEWIDGMEAGDIIVIPATNGVFDGGVPNMGQGYGDQEEKYLNSTFTLTYKDPNYKLNCDFYEAKKRSSRWKIAYRTSTLVHISDATASFSPKAPVADDMKSEVVWEVESKWTSSNFPCPYDTPDGVFDCVILQQTGA